jgi:predicted transcriptional regulator
MTSDGGSTRLRQTLENRHEVLQYLTTTPSTKPELVTALSAARSTIDRAIDDLQDVGCLSKRNGRYHATATGRVALTEYHEYVRSTDALNRSSTFLNTLPEDAPLDVALLRGAEISLADSHAPEAALAASIDVFRHATVLKGLAPVVLTFYPDLIADRVMSGGLSVEIIAQENVIGSFDDLASQSVDRLLDSESVTLYVTDEQLPYALWVMETPDGAWAGITAYDDGGVQGVLMNDSEAAVAWAREQYNEYRNHARTAHSVN